MRHFEMPPNQWERDLQNKNVCQVFGYFGNKKEQAREIIHQLGFTRACLTIYKKLFEVLIASS